MLNIHSVGWIKTFEKYFKDQTQHILNNMVVKMKDDKNRKFIWAEVSFFATWWEKVDSNTQLAVKKYVKNSINCIQYYILSLYIIHHFTNLAVLYFNRLLTDGQLEIVTGGWVMTDEATSHYYAMIEQMIVGHQWLEQNLG